MKLIGVYLRLNVRHAHSHIMMLCRKNIKNQRTKLSLLFRRVKYSDKNIAK